MDFWDDCGVWDTKTTSNKTSYFIKNTFGNLESCIKKGGFFGKEIKRKFTPFEPQPTDIFTLRRYYATLKREKTLRNVFLSSRQCLGTHRKN